MTELAELNAHLECTRGILEAILACHGSDLGNWKEDIDELADQVKELVNRLDSQFETAKTKLAVYESLTPEVLREASTRVYQASQWLASHGPDTTSQRAAHVATVLLHAAKELEHP